MTADQDKTRNNPPGGKTLDEPVDALRNPKSLGSDSSEVDKQGAPSTLNAQGSDTLKPDSKHSDDSKGSMAGAVSPAEKGAVRQAGNQTGRDTDKSGQSSAAKSGLPGKPDNPENSDKPGKAGYTNMTGSSGSSSNSSSPTHTVAWVSAVALVMVVFLGLALWWQHQRFEAVAREVATRLQQTDRTVNRLQQDAQTALAASSSQAEKLGALGREIRSVRSEMTSMDQAWQSMSRSLDDNLVLSNIRRLLNMAQQQLTLLGNVNSTIAVLETAQSLLEGHQNQEQFGDLLKAVQADLERLRSTPQVNIDALAAKLNRLVDITEKAPLQIPDPVAPGLSPVSGMAQEPAPASGAAVAEGPATQAAPQVQATAESESIWWRRWLDEASEAGATAAQVVSREFSDLMQIRKADQSQVLLLSEEQAMLVRTNLRSMLLSAQLALLNQQPEIWVADLKSVRSVLQNYYNPDSLDTRTALRLTDELQSAPITLSIEPITESLSALAVTAQAIAVPDNTGVTN
ncbi:uroporphyrinogen-III C-methyltransferase [Orrella marina]|uniref:Uroporphyrinogen-III C-methyltransferase n=1 Tax=Orrella marina TaxID=2163011 RepID=A0A2R4XGS1_9BURK|nr:uroporphyrinogen-III C-methyltransferase [Orrella marina]AWB32883.1 hypothetical protein DBV39_03170 [Orrella marina]